MCHLIHLDRHFNPLPALLVCIVWNLSFGFYSGLSGRFSVSTPRPSGLLLPTCFILTGPICLCSGFLDFLFPCLIQCKICTWLFKISHVQKPLALSGSCHSYLKNTFVEDNVIYLPNTRQRSPTCHYIIQNVFCQFMLPRWKWYFSTHTSSKAVIIIAYTTLTFL